MSSLSSKTQITIMSSGQWVPQFAFRCLCGLQQEGYTTCFWYGYFPLRFPAPCRLEGRKEGEVSVVFCIEHNPTNRQPRVCSNSHRIQVSPNPSHLFCAICVPFPPSPVYEFSILENNLPHRSTPRCELYLVPLCWYHTQTTRWEYRVVARKTSRLLPHLNQFQPATADMERDGEIPCCCHPHS